MFQWMIHKLLWKIHVNTYSSPYTTIIHKQKKIREEKTHTMHHGDRQKKED